MTINQMSTERKKAFREAKKLLRSIDSVVELAERYIDSVLVRKNKIPELEDLQKLLTWSKDMMTNLTTLISFANTLTALFGAF